MERFLKMEFDLVRIFTFTNLKRGYTQSATAWRYYVFIVNFKQISHIFLVFPLMTLNKYMPGEYSNWPYIP